MTVSPEAITVRRGTTGQVTVQVEASGGFKGRVDLLSSLLYETKTTFEPTALETGSGTAALRIAPSAGAIKGTYVLSVSGVAGSFTHSAFVRLTIK